MVKFFFIRTQTALVFAASCAASVLAVAIAPSPPAIAQDPEMLELEGFGEVAESDPESVLVEATIVGDVDPAEATTIEDLTIPTDQLELLVKPLTLEELQTEAAAWFLLLKSKVQEISITEIAIKRENLLLQQEEDAAKAVEVARTKLTDAEAGLEAAKPGTSKHERSTKALEEAKAALLEAEQAVEVVRVATEDLEADSNVQDALAEAEMEEALAQAKETLQEAEQERNKLATDSDEYQVATEQIDPLKAAIAELGAAEAKVTAAVPGSEDYVVAEQALNQVRDRVIQASNGLITAGLAPTIAAEQAAANPANAPALDGSAKILTQASQTLEAAEQKREAFAVGAPEYQAATEKIDALSAAIAALEVAEVRASTAIPDSSIYSKATKKLGAARAQIKQALEAVVAAGLAPELAIEATDTPPETGDTATEEEATSKGNAPDTDPTTDTTDNLKDAGEAAEDLADIDQVLKSVAEAESDLKNQLVANVAELQSEQSALIERLDIVLEELEEKGGRATSYQKYIDAVSGIELDIQDTEGLIVRLTAWLKSKEGGIRWGLGLGQFVGIVVVAAVLAEFAESFSSKILRRFNNISDLFRQFLIVSIKRGFLVMGVLLALTSLGVSLGPLLALVGGVSFVLAFALQSNLSNFASGLMLLINKPFDVGDEVELAGYWAFVDSISLANTCLRDYDGNLLYLPNDTVWGGEITNYTHSKYRRLKFVLHVHLSQNIMEVAAMWTELTANHPAIVDEPEPGMSTESGARTPLNYCLRLKLYATTPTEGFWQVHKEVLDQLQQQLQIREIEIAPPPELEDGDD